jgi:FHS family L-fucose permease-like MFS transporter
MTTPANTNRGALSTLVTVFFFWGFIAAGNNVFIPFCKHYFHLDQFQSQLIDFAFYLAYYVGALMLFVYSQLGGIDLVGRWGYKKSIVFGLLFSALGALAMILAVNGNNFIGMLLGLFIVALGFSLQQTAAQPLAISLGDPLTGATRVNLGGGVNSFGTTIGPLVVALALFGTARAVGDDEINNLPLNKVITLYTFVGLLFLGAAALFGFSKKVPSGITIEKQEPAKKALASMIIITGLLILCFVPVFSSYKSDDAKQILILEEKINAATVSQIIPAQEASEVPIGSDQLSDEQVTWKAELDEIRGPLERKRLFWLLAALAVVVVALPLNNALAKRNSLGWGAMQFPQLVLGMLAIFVYVGVEVAMGSNLAELLKQKEFGGLQSSQTAPYIAMFWGSLMIGRWTGAVAAFGFSNKIKNLLKFIVPFVALGVVMLFTSLAGHDVLPLKWYFLCVIVQVIAAWLSKDNPSRTLFYFGILGMIALSIGTFTTGNIAVYAILSGGLACSIMWPSIFTLSIAGLGKYTTQGSAFLIMMILGGSILPPIQGKLADVIGIHPSYGLAILCFAYLTWFAFRVKMILAAQGINVDTTDQAGH